MQSDRLAGLFDRIEEELRLCMSLSEGSYANFRNFARDHEGIASALAANQPARAYELSPPTLTMPSAGWLRASTPGKTRIRTTPK